jgi:hypothetical protein
MPPLSRWELLRVDWLNEADPAEMLPQRVPRRAADAAQVVTVMLPDGVLVSTFESPRELDEGPICPIYVPSASIYPSGLRPCSKCGRACSTRTCHDCSIQ